MAGLSEDEISLRLQRAYRPGELASTNGYASLLEGVELKCAAVLMPLARLADEWHFLFSRRTNEVEHHKGQVSFPGGACDTGDSGPEATALREAEEEIGLCPSDVRLLGRLGEMATITGYRVAPVVGVIPWPYEFVVSRREVERLFFVPLAWLARRENWQEHLATPDGIPRPLPVVIYHPYDGEVIWGATARMVLNFLVTVGMIKK